MSELLKEIPQVSLIIEQPEFKARYGRFEQNIVINLIREAINSVRQEIIDGSIKGNVQDEVLKAITKKLSILHNRSLIRIINATGIVLHTNLGRAPMRSNPYLSSILEGYCNLEIDLSTGKRGRRGVHVKTLLQVLTGAQTGVVVNNNASAILLFLKTHAAGKEVIVSRGELIELGGSFRLPEVMETSGAILREVGTTNRTHLHDYANAINEKTAIILKVHPSNYAIRGFSIAPTTLELSKLAKEKGVIFAYDIGSGLIRPVDHPNFRDEPNAVDAITDGADVILFSGDKILGGTQAGFIVGTENTAGACGKLPLMRSLRLSKGHMCMIEETLRVWLLPNDEVIKTNPVMRMISMTLPDLEIKARQLQEMVISLAPHFNPQIVSLKGQMGGGSLPDVDFDSFGVALNHKSNAQNLMAKLRSSIVPIIARVEEDKVVIDVRTLQDGEDKIVAEALSKINA